MGEGAQTGSVGNIGTNEHRPEPMAVSHYLQTGQRRGPAKAGTFSMELHTQQACSSENLKEETGWELKELEAQVLLHANRISH